MNRSLTAQYINARKKNLTNQKEQGIMTMEMHNPLRGGRKMTAESVTNGHPDKVCDQISDAILDAALLGDSGSRVAVETCGKGGILVFGEMTTRSQVDAAEIAKRVYREIGYTDDLPVKVDLTEQSGDIALINDPGEQGAGDQGIMVGYAIRNPDHEHMPTVVAMAHKLTMRLEAARRDGTLPWLGPDGKSQVMMEDGRVAHVTIAAQHGEAVELEELRRRIWLDVILPVVGEISFGQCTINGTGKFMVGGFAADSGLTGRKIVVDQYGPLVEIGGGCFSGKDPSKVDRTAAYMARFIAKTIVASERANEAVVKLAFTINGKRPDMLSIETDKGPERDRELERWAEEEFPLSPGGMIRYFDLLKPNGWSFRETAAYGHFGRAQFPWEKVRS